MKIAYLAGYAENSLDNSVTRKLEGQIASWRAHGHDVRLLQLSPSIGHKRKGLARQIHYYSAYLRLGMEVKRQVEAFQPDVIYSRYFQFSPHLVDAVRRFVSVLEVNSDDRSEYRQSSLGVQLVNRMMRDRVYGSFDGLVVVTSELGTRLAGGNQRWMCIANGIPDAEIQGSPVPNNERPVVGFIGSGGVSWHGQDDLREFARRHPEFEFRVIGESADWGLANVRRLGKMSHVVAGSELARCDVAVSSLGLYRLGMEEACPLKSRQYLAIGLPIIIGYMDPDLTQDPAFVCRVPNRTGGILELENEVVEFIWKAQGNREWRNQATSFAREFLGNSKKESVRLQFLEGLVRDRRGLRV